MKETFTNQPGDAGDSWANETLPMGLRRELLDRELRKFAERQARAAASGAASRTASPEHPAGGSEPPARDRER